MAAGCVRFLSNIIGIRHGFAVMHGKTRRGALVFDVADLIKDAIVLPGAFICARNGLENQEYDWIYLPEIKSLAAMAGALHDWGKADAAFQKMLKKASNGKRENIRLLLLYARNSLMLSDYTVSAAKADRAWPQDCALFANTDKQGLKQRLDEHLVRVSTQAAQAAIMKAGL